MTSPVQQGQSGSWAAEPAEDGAVNSTVREDEMNNGEYADATRPNEVGAVRSPQAAGRDYEVEQGRTGMTRNEDAGPADPSIPGSVTYETTSPAGTGGTAPAPGYANRRHGGRIRTRGRHCDRVQRSPGDDRLRTQQPGPAPARQRGRAPPDGSPSTPLMPPPTAAVTGATQPTH